MKDTKEMSDAKTANELAEKYAKSIGDGEESDAYEKRIAAWLAGHSAGLSEGVSRIKELEKLLDAALEEIQERDIEDMRADGVDINDENY